MWAPTADDLMFYGLLVGFVACFALSVASAVEKKP
jgi:hypothetical protein